jgi:flagellar protein FlgJ
MVPAQGISLPVTLSHQLPGKVGANVHQANASSKIKTTAKEFEATMLSMLIKEMRQTLDEDGGLFPGDNGDIQGGLFDMFMSRHLADSGGIGVAAYLVKHLNTATTTKPTATINEIPAAARSTHSVVPSAPRH